MSKIHVQTTINGEPAEFLANPGESLLDALQDIAAAEQKCCKCNAKGVGQQIPCIGLAVDGPGPLRQFDQAAENQQPQQSSGTCRSGCKQTAGQYGQNSVTDCMDDFIEVRNHRFTQNTRTQRQVGADRHAGKPERQPQARPSQGFHSR